ncbi:hypothetical protein BG006_010956 [Podila minutissima]|uniref:Translation initiation factor 3 N-terminal domain-containing protein n=1 Tax=Podila minutissima TaxID=64525 RepID=A0A9P5SF55_9FUNG|nr:hypothetical protein BG006_010956 [Podila minutissima]
MIPIRHTVSAFSASAKKTIASSYSRNYTSRSNGSAFLNNLDFLAPAPTSRTGAPAPTQPKAFQQSKAASMNRATGPSQSSNRDFLRTQNANNNSGPPPVKNSFASKRVTPASSMLGSSLLDELTNNRRPVRRPAQNNANNPSSPSSINNPILKSIPNNSNRNTNNSVNRASDRLANDKRPPLDRPRRDEEIESQWIQYVSLEGNQGEQRLSAVLRTFDRSQYFLVEVDANAYPPICKLFSKRELYEKAKAAKQAKKANAPATKELQLNWGTDAHDLEHKLSRSRGFLEKGCRLDVQINGKKGKSTTPQEREAIMERVKAEFEPVSKYVKQPEWVKATTVTMLLQGIAKKEAKK